MGAAADMFNVTSWLRITLTLTLTIKRLLNVVSKILNLFYVIIKAAKEGFFVRFLG